MNEDKLTAEDARKLRESEGNNKRLHHAENKLRKIHKSIRKETLKGGYSLPISFLFGDIERYCIHELSKEGYNVIHTRPGGFYTVEW